MLQLLPVLLTTTVDATLIDCTHRIFYAFPQTRPTIQAAFLQAIIQFGFAQRGVSSTVIHHWTLSELCVDTEHLLKVYQILSAFHLDLATNVLEELAASLNRILPGDADEELRLTAANACLNILSHTVDCSTGPSVSASSTLYRDVSRRRNQSMDGSIV